MTETSVPQRNTRNLVAVIFAILLPTFVTMIYFKWLADHPAAVQQTAYSIGKTIQFVFPVVWVWLFFRYRFQRSKSAVATNTDGTAIPNWLWSVGFGIGVCVVMGVAFWLLGDSDEIAGMRIKLGEKVSGLGVASVWKFALLGLFYAIVHSFSGRILLAMVRVRLAEKFCQHPAGQCRVESRVYGPSRNFAQRIFWLVFAVDMALQCRRRHRRSLLGVAVSKERNAKVVVVKPRDRRRRNFRNRLLSARPFVHGIGLIQTPQISRLGVSPGCVIVAPV